MKAISSLALWLPLSAFAAFSAAQTQNAKPAAPAAAADSASAVQTNSAHPDSATVKTPPPPMSVNDDDDEGDGDDEDSTGSVAKPSLSFLLPADGDVIYSADVKIVAYAQGPTPAGMLAVLDGFSLDRPLNFEDGMLTVDLPDMKPGVHEIKVMFLNEKHEIQLTRAVRFFVRVPEPYRKPVKGGFRQFGRVVAQMDWMGDDAQGQVAKQSSLNLRRIPAVDTTIPVHDSLVTGKGQTPLSQNLNGAAEISYSVKDDLLEGYVKGLASTGENSYLQPIDRLSGRVSYGPWAYVKGGDVYPTYNPLILNGTRIRGGEVGVAAVTDDGEQHWMYLKAVTGETERAVPAYVAEYDTGGGRRADTIPATPEQRLTAFRVGAGGGQTFDLGLTVMRASDRNSDSLSQVLNDTLHGVRPVDNLVTGVDARLGLWDGRIQIYGQWAGSLYTRDRSLGADSTVKGFSPFFIANGTTQGWQYLASNDSGSRDIEGFINANSTYETGVTTSIPFDGVVAETELRYSHLGLEYHSEGNPFLGTNPGDGWDLQQRLVVLDNRLFFGVEAESFVQDLGLYKQDERGLKGEIRFIPGGYQPAFWISGGLTNRAPRGDYPYQFNQQFDQLNVGGFHQIVLGPGTLHGSVLYAYTRSALDLKSAPIDTSVDTTGLLSFPVSQTNIINTAWQYKFRGSDFTPKLSYTFANNGVQDPTNNVSAGMEDAFFRQQFRADFEVLVGQYPLTNTQNDLSLGETVSLIVRVGSDQSVRFNENWIQYGQRNSITAGGYYEMFF